MPKLQIYCNFYFYFGFIQIDSLWPEYCILILFCNLKLFHYLAEGKKKWHLLWNKYFFITGWLAHGRVTAGIVLH